MLAAVFITFGILALRRLLRRLGHPRLWDSWLASLAAGIGLALLPSAILYQRMATWVGGFHD